jgi:hypothetical protein
MINSKGSTKMNSGSRIGAAALTGLCAIGATLALAGPAQAKTYTATGAGKGDKAVSFELDVDAKAKKGKLKSASSISRLVMKNAAFECSATGEGGRGDYADFGLPTEPAKIAKNGKFSDVYEVMAGKYVVERYTLSGKVTGRGKNLVVTGTFKAEKGAGGLQFNDCSTGDVPFTVKAKL